MTSLKTAAAAAVLAGALALCASSALARAPLTTVHCGQTLTTSVRLANDLTDCPGDGLVAGADGITVDLDGHTIDGVASTACDRPDAPSHGIADAGNDGVTIENGTVRQFDFGVSAGSATDGLSNGRIHHMTLVDDTFGGVSLGTGGGAALMAGDRIDHNVVSGSACGDGLKLNGGRDDRFTDNRVAGSETGITICCSVNDVDNVVQGNAVSDSGSLGILLFSSASDDLVGNRIDGSGDTGILVNGQTSDDLVKGNVIDHTQETGLLVAPCCGDNPDAPSAVRIVENTLTATADGIIVIQSDGNEVSRNTVLATGTFGDPADFGVGVLIDAGSRELVAGNTLANGRGPGVMVGVPPELEPSPGPVDGNVVVRNAISHDGGDGIQVAAIAQDTALRHNVAERNGADGLDVLSPSTTIARNAANRNAAFGIEAVPGVTDGGGNIAHANGNPVQCTGVVCS